MTKERCPRRSRDKGIRETNLVPLHVQGLGYRWYKRVARVVVNKERGRTKKELVGYCKSWRKIVVGRDD